MTVSFVSRDCPEDISEAISALIFVDISENISYWPKNKSQMEKIFVVLCVLFTDSFNDSYTHFMCGETS